MLEINPEKTTEELVGFIKSAFKKAGFSRAVVAVSGGVDSTTSAALAVRALEKENVFPLILPYGNLGPQGTSAAQRVIAWLQIPATNVARVDIKPLIDPIFTLDPSPDNIRRGNIMARIRMTLLFDQAKKRRALVIGTENKSERLLGYFTRFGDEASDVEPLRNLYKTQVYALAKCLSVPETILSREPTADLWEGQTDEGELGFTYAQADPILHLLYEEKKSVEEAVAAGLALSPPEGFSQEVVEKVIDRVTKNSFKHYLPYTPS